ncbi:hypothetical protein HNQ64_003671 [Prosthecobacter dejongeii]|uniref:Uncharacterized protein n=1 Tax=Prosthecobacter dejongeii TaxID=48465 RepID=A0A7W7YNG6_9BACT|nr:hypothetical protein [Prosthecobacter dejongeii]
MIVNLVTRQEAYTAMKSLTALHDGALLLLTLYGCRDYHLRSVS